MKPLARSVYLSRSIRSLLGAGPAPSPPMAPMQPRQPDIGWRARPQKGRTAGLGTPVLEALAPRSRRGAGAARAHVAAAPRIRGKIGAEDWGRTDLSVARATRSWGTTRGARAARAPPTRESDRPFRAC